MNEVLPVLVASVAGAFLAAACSTGLSRRERNWVAASFLIHVGFASVQVPLTLSFYGGGDMFSYFYYGELLAQMMERDPLHSFPEVTALLFRQEPHLPMSVMHRAGTSTGSMAALSAWSFYLLGPSKYANCIVFAMLSLCGKIAIYRVFRSNLDPAFRPHAAVAALFVPSFVFWSSGLYKEAVAVAGVGWSLLGLHLWIRRGRTVSGWAIMVAGAIPILLIKAYVLLPLALAGGSWYYWARSLKRGRVRIRPSHLVAAALLGIGGIVLIGHYSPEYAFDNLTAETSYLQQVGRYHRLRGGSHFTLSDEVPTTLVGQLIYAPAALLASLFRPALFEAHNLLMLANAVETTALTLLFARILFTRNLGNVRRQIAGDPFLIFCVVFVAAFGIAVGLASTNLGTLSRYRCLLLPFFAVLLFVLGKPLSARSPARTVRRTPETALNVA